MQRMRSANYRCVYCGRARGYWLPSRRRWECDSCKKQAGTRAGTVMAGSPLRLSVWFSAIRNIVRHPKMPATEMAAALGLRRLPTVRGLARKIRATLDVPERSDLLAGLDEVFAARLPETGAPPQAVFAKRPRNRTHGTQL